MPLRVVWEFGGESCSPSFLEAVSFVVPFASAAPGDIGVDLGIVAPPVERWCPGLTDPDMRVLLQLRAKVHSLGPRGWPADAEVDVWVSQIRADNYPSFPFKLSLAAEEGGVAGVRVFGAPKYIIGR